MSDKPPFSLIFTLGPLPPKWSDHCDDVCPKCQEHTGTYAFTYEFNGALMDCPLCGALLLSGYNGGVFIWRLYK